MAVRIFASIAEALAHTTPRAERTMSWNPVDHALSRLAFGPNASARERVKARGIPAWYDEQVKFGASRSGYAGNALVAAEGPLLALSPSALRFVVETSKNGQLAPAAMDQLARVTLGLQAWSEAQLYETLVDFCSNHLNVANHREDVWNTRHAYDRDVIRRHAMGSFTAMLLASARHPAMLQYLDLARSAKNAVNENYGRELLELHTVGLGYTEADVRNASYLLTGRTIDKHSDYAYVPANHWTGPVQVQGFSHANASPADGEAGADAMIRHLATRPATAKLLATKLCTRFVSDAPSPDLVAAVAKAYLDSGTQILPMLSVIVRSDEFWASRGAKVRRPAEHLIATVRILDLRPTDMSKALPLLHQLAAQVGHVPLDAPVPTGYADVAAAWRSAGTLVQTWRRHLNFAWSDWPKIFAVDDRTALYDGIPATSGDALARLGWRLTGGALMPEQLAALQGFLGEPAGTPMAQSALRTQLPSVVALILDGPQHALR